ncbi:hypothetical protein L6452_27739 [Arctium lappa]|uniref:Uncharacterized protein n=1 Tax=Arctium lappa TaxID=4217 RepID=A0ACB8ZXK9_ARCLA|nr:hypothetical protein L6452_27739 [Arctium lappa]
MPLLQEPPLTSMESHNAWLKHYDDSIVISRLMLETMVPSLSERMEMFPRTTFDMINLLREWYLRYVCSECFYTVQALHRTKMEEGQDVSSHIHKMRTHFDYLDRLGYPYPNGIAVAVILKSLTKAFDVFVENLNIDPEEISISDLHTMLEDTEKSLPKVTVTSGICGNIDR